jgi:hypothetical protein
MTILTVPVKVERGVIRTIDGSPLPEEAYALLVILPESSKGENLAEWQLPFDAFFELVRRNRPSDLEHMVDTELNAIVHEARQPR